ncbi:Uncharacterised protein g5981 [Pycnogonum litorale]
MASKVTKDDSKLRNNWSILCAEVKHYHITPILQEKLVVSDADLEEIIKQSTEMQQTSILLEILEKKGVEAIQAFCEAMEVVSPNYKHLAASLSIRNDIVTVGFINAIKDNMHVQKRWRSLAHRLSMSKQANNIQKEANIYMHTSPEIVVNLLEQWQEVNGEMATCGNLYDALKDEEFNDLCFQLRKTFVIS